MTANPFDALVAEYEQWLACQPSSLTGLSDTSAEALLHENITDAQRRFLSDYIIRWEAAENALMDLQNDDEIRRAAEQGAR